MNKRPWLNDCQRRQAVPYDFHPFSPIPNGITKTRCLQARSFCCFCRDTELMIVVMMVLLSLNLDGLIIAGVRFAVNLPVVDNRTVLFKAAPSSMTGMLSILV